ncbi:hypothetical protein Ahy_A07g031088 isoform B [Arachis hypogaea]|uniref:Uncharacterized protein n=1 Tax=Arachis hypogaea TaxID=3818 RepID=A0A445C2T6_ARAHY|nr:hypothetical protein Ahy_A07g031088 isoform B [Arachis hypogaea]
MAPQTAHRLRVHLPPLLHLAPIHDIFLALSESMASEITPFSSSNEMIKGITTSKGFSHINFTPSEVCSKI